METGLISIIIPTYNRARLLPETLNSLLAQTYQNWECIIVDDGSTDDTIEVIRIFLVLDHRFSFYLRPKEKPKGANACRNYGFLKSTGEYINWFDSDDIMHPDFLKLKIEILQKDIELDFSACISQTFENNIKQLLTIERPKVLQSKKHIEDYLLHGLFFHTPAPLWRKQFLISKNLFDEALHRSQESDFHFRMLAHGVNYFYLNKVLIFYRANNNSITNSASKSIIAQQSVFKYFDGIFEYLLTNKALDSRKMLIQYVFYRQATNYYNLNTLSKGFIGRLKIFIKYSKYIIGYLFSTRILIRYSFKLCLGIIVVLFLNKGYRYFYYPKYDFRTC